MVKKADAGWQLKTKIAGEESVNNKSKSNKKRKKERSKSILTTIICDDCDNLLKLSMSNSQ